MKVEKRRRMGGDRGIHLPLEATWRNQRAYDRIARLPAGRTRKVTVDDLSEFRRPGGIRLKDTEHTANLALKIRQGKKLSPLVVQVIPKTHDVQILDGAHRLNAARMLDWKSLPVVVAPTPVNMRYTGLDALTEKFNRYRAQQMVRRPKKVYNTDQLKRLAAKGVKPGSPQDKINQWLVQRFPTDEYDVVDFRRKRRVVSKKREKGEPRLTRKQKAILAGVGAGIGTAGLGLAVGTGIGAHEILSGASYQKLAEQFAVGRHSPLRWKRGEGLLVDPVRATKAANIRWENTRSGSPLVHRLLYRRAQHRYKTGVNVLRFQVQNAAQHPGRDWVPARELMRTDLGRSTLKAAVTAPLTHAKDMRSGLRYSVRGPIGHFIWALPEDGASIPPRVMYGAAGGTGYLTYRHMTKDKQKTPVAKRREKGEPRLTRKQKAVLAGVGAGIGTVGLGLAGGTAYGAYRAKKENPAYGLDLIFSTGKHSPFSLRDKKLMVDTGAAANLASSRYLNIGGYLTDSTSPLKAALKKPARKAMLDARDVWVDANHGDVPVSRLLRSRKGRKTVQAAAAAPLIEASNLRNLYAWRTWDPKWKTPTGRFVHALPHMGEAIPRRVISGAAGGTGYLTYRHMNKEKPVAQRSPVEKSMFSRHGYQTHTRKEHGKSVHRVSPREKALLAGMGVGGLALGSAAVYGGYRYQKPPLGKIPLKTAASKEGAAYIGRNIRSNAAAFRRGTDVAGQMVGGTLPVVGLPIPGGLLAKPGAGTAAILLGAAPLAGAAGAFTHKQSRRSEIDLPRKRANKAMKRATRTFTGTNPTARALSDMQGNTTRQTTFDPDTVLPALDRAGYKYGWKPYGRSGQRVYGVWASKEPGVKEAYLYRGR